MFSRLVLDARPMRILLSCLVVLAISTAAAAPHKVAATGFTVMAVDGWTDKTAGADLSLVNGPDFALRASLLPAIAERVAKAVKDPKECAAFTAEFAKSMSADSAKGAITKISKRAICEMTATLAGNVMVALTFPVGANGAVVLCIAAAKSPDKKRLEECRTMAASLALDPKAKPAAAAPYTTSKQAGGVTRVTAGKAQMDLPAGWVVKDGSAGQLFSATKGNAVLSLTRVERSFKGDTEANCKKLAGAAGGQAGVTGDGRILKLRPGNACLVSIETDKLANVAAYINVPGAAEHVLISCLSLDKDLAVLKECGVALGTLAFP